MKRQQSAGSSSSQRSSQFAFNLPETSETAESQLAGSEISSQGASNDPVAGPSRVTLHRTESHEPADGPVCEVTRDLQSDSDSNSSLSLLSLSQSDLESSSSGSSPDLNRKQLLVQPFLEEKSQDLRKRYQSSQELLQKLFICISGKKSYMINILEPIFLGNESNNCFSTSFRRMFMSFLKACLFRNLL